MLKAIFTLDYEIHGNGDGSPWALMVEPTQRMLALFERYGAKLTIMADVAEILKFREYEREFGRDDYYYQSITEQLRDAVRRGHDVQLHIHSSYFNAKHLAGRWQQDWSEYNFAGLSLDRLKAIVKLGKEFLESLLQPVQSNYRCDVFRAANWSVSPSRNVVQALVENGIRIDTSVFKYGWREGLVNFDYTHAWSGLLPWKVDANDICVRNDNGQLFEFPIYSESRWLGAFLTPQRIHRTCVSWLHRFSTARDNGPGDPPEMAYSRPESGGKTRRFKRHAWKADFNQCSGRQLIRALERAELEYGNDHTELPFVLIAHSKLFTHFNEWSLRSFLKFLADRPQRFGSGIFADFDLCAFEGDVKSSPRRVQT